jgi:hypothetical protein
LYYPGLLSDLSETEVKFYETEIKVNSLREELYGVEVEGYEQRIGGLENDLKLL